MNHSKLTVFPHFFADVVAPISEQIPILNVNFNFVISLVIDLDNTKTLEIN